MSLLFIGSPTYYSNDGTVSIKAKSNFKKMYRYDDSPTNKTRFANKIAWQSRYMTMSADAFMETILDVSYAFCEDICASVRSLYYPEQSFVVATGDKIFYVADYKGAQPNYVTNNRDLVRIVDGEQTSHLYSVQNAVIQFDEDNHVIAIKSLAGLKGTGDGYGQLTITTLRS
jgi:hypothetical protein